MGFPIVDRYADLVKSIVPGSYYENQGILVPYRSGPTQLRVETGQASVEFGVYVNEIFAGTEVADTDGNVVFGRVLPRGEVVVTLLSRTDGRYYYTYLTVREYALWLAAYAEVLENIDAQIIQVRDNVSIETAELEALQDVYGSMVSTYANIGQGTENYRYQLQELRQAYRDKGSLYGGLDEVISTFTQVPPFGYTRRKWGPNWILDQSMLLNHRFLDRSHQIVRLSTNITGVTALRAEADVPGNSVRTLAWNHVTRTLTWNPSFAGPATLVHQGEMFIPGPASLKAASVLGEITHTGPFTTAATHRYLYINVDHIGTVTVDLPAAAYSVADVVLAINTAFLLDPRYNYTIATDYNGRVLLESPTVTTGQGSVEIESGANNAAAQIFGCQPGDIHFIKGEGLVMTGVDLVKTTCDLDDISGPARLYHRYNPSSATPHSFTWHAPSKSAGSYAVCSADGEFTITDASSNTLTFQVWLDTLNTYPVLTTELAQFDFTFDRYAENFAQTQGLWVEIDTALLPAASVSDNLVVYDDLVDTYPETPDFWFISPAPDSTAMYPSEVRSAKVDPMDPSSAMQWRITSSRNPSHSLTSHALKFPVLEGLPRGGNYPQKSSGLLYDYEGYAITFSGWFKSLNAGSLGVVMGLSYDGGTTWEYSPYKALVEDVGTKGVENAVFASVTDIIPSTITSSSLNTWGDSGVMVQAAIVKPTDNIDVIVDGLNIQVEYISSQFLGNATPSRNRHRQYFGELLYVWAPEAMSLAEKKYLGLPHKSVNRNAPMGGVTVSSISTATPNGTGILEYEYNSVAGTRKIRWMPSGTSFAPGLGWVGLTSDGTYTIDAPDGSTIGVDIVYAWLPNLTGTAPVTLSKSLIISDATSDEGGGHSRRILPAHSTLDIFDVTEYNTDGTPINLAGLITETDFANCTYYNLEIHSADPFKYAFLYPDSLPQEAESLVIALSGGNWEATLDYYSDQDQTNAILYENGIPVPNTMWAFTGANTIAIPNTWMISSDLSASSTYTIDYNLLYQIETPPIDLGTAFQDYAWFADYFLWQRAEKEQDDYYAEVPVYPSTENGRAILQNSSNMDRTTAALFVQQATEAREIPQRYWRFIDSKTIEIDLAYLVEGQYYLQHYEAKVYVQDNLTVLFEHKSGDTPAACMAARYAPIERNENVYVHQYWAPHQFHQLRLTVAGIRDLRDFRIRSLVLKGLHLHGRSPNVPGLTNLWSGANQAVSISIGH